MFKRSGLRTGFKQWFPIYNDDDANDDDDDDEMRSNRNFYNNASTIHHLMNRIHMVRLTSFSFSAISLATASSESSDVTLRGSNSFPILGSLWVLFLHLCSSVGRSRRGLFRFFLPPLFFTVLSSTTIKKSTDEKYYYHIVVTISWNTQVLLHCGCLHNNMTQVSSYG